jgi:hypothetical protein
MSTQTDAKIATIYRLATPEHVCPYGLKSLDLLKRECGKIRTIVWLPR